MKIIQTFWSKPFSSGTQSNAESRHDGGWLHFKYFLYCWALSCLKLREFYSDVELYTDSIGKNLLIDRLELPYSKVQTDLDNYNSFHPDLWAIGKLHSYQCQDQPFLHVDGDVIISKRFSPQCEASELIVQNLETDFLTDNGMFYGSIRSEVLEHFRNVPYEIRNSNFATLKSVNMGVTGGINSNFFKVYSRIALNFVENNIQCLDRINISRFNVLFEQFLFYQLAESRNKDISVILHECDLEQRSFVNFHLLPNINTFIHVLGPFKRNQFLCEQVELRLKHEFPLYYDRINQYLQIKSEPIPSYWKKKFETLSGINQDFQNSYQFKCNKLGVSPYVNQSSQIHLLLRTYGDDESIKQISQLIETKSEAFRPIVSLPRLKSPHRD